MFYPSTSTNTVKVLRGVIAFFIILITPIAAVGTFLLSVIFLPLPAVLPAPEHVAFSSPSTVLDINRNPIAEFRSFELNLPVRREDIPLHLKQAVIATEDRNFYKHGGIDLRGSMRALWADIRNKEVVQGGSTITQQYVKNVYTGGERSIKRKLREAVIANRLANQEDKETILYKYLTSVYLGEGTYGVGAAAEAYFRKPVSQLTVSESALLAGLLPAPSRYEPRGNLQLAEARRQLVLRQMHQEGYLDDRQLAEAQNQVLWFASNDPPSGTTVIHPPGEQPNAYPYFVDYVRRYLIARYGRDKVYRGGLRIQTTLDPKMQAVADSTVAQSLAGTVPPLEMALVTVEPSTGYVKAMVGGRDFYSVGGQVNRALGNCPVPPPDVRTKTEVEATCWQPGSGTVSGGGSGRQPGSSYKTFVLATALSQGIPPTRVYRAPNAYVIPGCTGSRGCTIRNYEGASYGSADLRRATWKSINTVYAQLTREVGVKALAETSKRLGITSAFYSPAVHGLSYGIGALEVAPLDMASAYGVFAARGMRAEPTPVLKIVDAKGTVLLDNTSPKSTRALEEAVADNVTGILRGVITSGTGTRANIGRPAAGKTGTSQEWRDAWFVGYTPNLSTAVWMGYSDRPRTMSGIKGVGRVTGGSIPAMAWHNFMIQALADVPVTDFSGAAPVLDPDELRRKARGGIDPGPAQKPQETPRDCDGPCEIRPPVPRPTLPPDFDFGFNRDDFNFNDDRGQNRDRDRDRDQDQDRDQNRENNQTGGENSVERSDRVRSRDDDRENTARTANEGESNRLRANGGGQERDRGGNNGGGLESDRTPRRDGRGQERDVTQTNNGGGTDESTQRGARNDQTRQENGGGQDNERIRRNGGEQNSGEQNQQNQRNRVRNDVTTTTTSSSSDVPSDARREGRQP